MVAMGFECSKAVIAFILTRKTFLATSIILEPLQNEIFQAK